MKKEEIISAMLYIRDVYIPLLTDFLENRISALEFQDKYLDAFQADPYGSPTPEIFDVLQAIFEDADAHEPEPDPEYFQIGEQEFRECCEKNLQKLKAIVQAYNL